MSDSLYAFHGLLLDDLEDIHAWLIDDFIADIRAEVNAEPRMLTTFMDLVRHRSDCWCLSEHFEGIDLCIGFALFNEHENYLEVKSFAIASAYRRQGLGHRFALTVLNIIQQQISKPIRVIPINDSNGFWEEIGFRRLTSCRTDQTMELKESVPYEPIIT